LICGGGWKLPQRLNTRAEGNFRFAIARAQKRKTHCRGSRVGCAIVVPLQAIRPFDYRSGQALSITTKQKRNDLFRIRAD